MKIIVAGAGHGGLVAASLLAKRGADVTVFEQNPEQNLGYDWTDIFNLASIQEAGIPLPAPEDYWPACEMTFFNPARTAPIHASVPPEKSTESTMERRVLLRHLIQFARSNGVKFSFETTVENPLIKENRVIGFTIQNAAGKRDMLADLVIDAAGMNSPLRRQLPETMHIVNEFRRDQFFTVFRAFYKSTGAKAAEHPFNVYFLPLGRKSVAWFASEGGYVDLLCGSFENTTHAYAEEIRQALRGSHPDMGDNICRGGQVTTLPVRRPISRMVADGYAAIGDAAAMSVPLNGSGLTNSIRAGRLLAETVSALAPEQCTTAKLWPYQVNYMRQYGAPNASLDVIKDFIMTIRPETIDFLFERHILTAADMNKARTGQEIHFTLPSLVLRGLKGAAHLPAMLTLARAYFASLRLKRHTLRIPSEFNENAVRAWADTYDKIR